ncbi:uncharacterized protein beat-Ia [Eurosta solidaginis]|uniref:uncharacterized protein beat-Ia n=1 Tax=Eurosta solidaginis TaxID=178769 RepID=UPI0035308EA4
MPFANIFNSTMCYIFLCLLVMDFVTALRDVRVKIPHAARRGEKVTMNCLYDLEGDSLYSVKWYKGRREFYSFTPKETPAIKVYQIPGVRVERSASNESQLVLDAVTVSTTGKYSCEVSADAPSFHTEISAGELEVIVPGKDPIITGIRPRYRVGDIVRGNCTSRHSKPAANLTWTINGRETNPSHIRHHKPLREARELETAVSGIHFVITPQHFSSGKLKIKCAAHIHDIYWKSTEKSIEEDHHMKNINSVNTFSEDYFDLEEDDMADRSDTYITHIKGAVSSLNANGAAQQHCQCLSLLMRWTTLALAAWNTLRYFQQLCQQLSVWHKTMATEATTTISAEESAIVTAKGQLLSGTNTVGTTSKEAVIMKIKIITTTSEISVFHDRAGGVEQTKHRKRNETANLQLIERRISAKQHRQQQLPYRVECSKRPATQKHTLQLQKRSTKGVETLATRRAAIKSKTTTNVKGISEACECSAISNIISVCYCAGFYWSDNDKSVNYFFMIKSRLSLLMQ